MVARGEVHQIAGRQQGLRPESLGQLSMRQHAPNLLHERSVHTLSYPVVLRGLGGGGLVSDALLLEEASELPPRTHPRCPSGQPSL